MKFPSIQQLGAQYNIEVSLIHFNALAAFLKYKHFVELGSIYFDDYFLAYDRIVVCFCNNNFSYHKKALRV